MDLGQILQWLQPKHQQQSFDRLQNLSLSLSGSAAAVHDDVRQLASCRLAILTLSGLWPLKVCSIDGPLDVHQMAGLLLKPCISYMSMTAIIWLMTRSTSASSSA